LTPGHTIAFTFCEEKHFANVPAIVCRIEAKKQFKKRASCLRLIEVGFLAKLSKSEVDFANNHGTMPRQATELLHL